MRYRSRPAERTLSPIVRNEQAVGASGGLQLKGLEISTSGGIRGVGEVTVETPVQLISPLKRACELQLRGRI
jgi:hypothetical protein